MAYTSVSLPANPGGLNLRDQPDHVDPQFAIDLNNVSFTEKGNVVPRYGYGAWSSVAVDTGNYTSLSFFQTTSGTKQIIAGDATKIRAIDNGGTIVSTAQTFAGRHSFARYGGPTLEAIFVASESNLTPIYWNGTAWTTAPAFTLNGGNNPNGKLLAVTPWDNRLVSANFAGTSQGNNKSSVRFSKEGDPLTWNSALWFEDLTPGDGEQITAMIAWRESLFVFKETKFFRFYGTTSDSAGNPTFEYVSVTTGVGCVGQNAVAANRDGVYFVSQKGVYRTRGSDPEYLSDLIEPLFMGQLPQDYQNFAVNRARLPYTFVYAARERIFVSVTTGANTLNDTILAHSPNEKWWSVWQLPAQAMVRTPDDNQEDQFIFSPTNLLKRYSSDFTTDGGTAIPCRLRYAFTDFGDPSVKNVREVKVWGKGTFNIAVAKDFEAAINATSTSFISLSQDLWGSGAGGDTWGDGTNLADVWSQPPAITPKLYRRSVRGTFFSFQIETNQAFQLDRVTFNLRGKMVPSTVGVD